MASPMEQVLTSAISSTRQQVEQLQLQLAAAEQELRTLHSCQQAYLQTLRPSRPPQPAGRRRYTRVTPEAARDAVRMLGQFTLGELSAELGCSSTTARKQLRRLQERGIVGREGQGWSYQRPQASTAPARPEPKEAPSRPMRPAGPSGRRAKTGDKQIDRLLRSLRAQGCQVQTSGPHIKVQAPNGSLVVLARTPSDHRAWENSRAQLRSAGLKV